jgi:hypothetical protein
VPERVVFLSAFVFVAELPEVGELEFAFLFPPEDLQPKAIANKSIVATIEFRLAADIFFIPLGVLIERLGILLNLVRVVCAIRGQQAMTGAQPSRLPQQKQARTLALQSEDPDRPFIGQ